MDYTYLRDLLAAQNWKEADEETARIVLTLSGRKVEGWLDCESIAKFACDELAMGEGASDIFLFRFGLLAL
jgi:hypothetical protein